MEWGQKGSNHAGKVQMNNKDNTYAFYLDDIVFTQSNGQTIIPYKQAVKDKSLAYLVGKRYRWQKNGDQGLKRKLAQNTSHPHLCPVKNWLKIIDRLLRLVGPTVKDRPLAIYRCEKSDKILNICSDDLKNLMQYIVQTTYDITNKR